MSPRVYTSAMFSYLHSGSSLLRITNLLTYKALKAFSSQENFHLTGPNDIGMGCKQMDL